MITGIGVDIEETAHFRENLRNAKFLALIFTKGERDYCSRKHEPWVHFAGKFCAKEAVVKALPAGLALKDVEITNLPSGKIRVFVKGKKQAKIHCSISHTATHAIAFATAEK